ncbi:MAG: sigma-70 family RNA polymerase sigma factor [Pirellulaceae bacterium]|nr:sigma-70 family RNA polymerase sigma factor [Pirellulaceae bacterium]
MTALSAWSREHWAIAKTSFGAAATDDLFGGSSVTGDIDGKLDFQTLARLAVGGCEESFAQLAERFRPRLVHVLQRRLGSGHAQVDAEDVVQEALLKAYRNLAQYDSRYRFSTWLYTIAFRVAQDRLRQQRRWLNFVTEWSQLNRQAQPQSVERAVELEDQVEGLWSSARRLLTADQYAALWLRYGEDLEISEVSQILGKKPGNVRVLLHRARLVLIEHTTKRTDNTTDKTIVRDDA